MRQPPLRKPLGTLCSLYQQILRGMLYKDSNKEVHAGFPKPYIRISLIRKLRFGCEVQGTASFTLYI